MTLLGIAAALAGIAWFIRAVRKENRRQHLILQQFNHDNPIKEPGFSREKKED